MNRSVRFSIALLVAFACASSLRAAPGAATAPTTQSVVYRAVRAAAQPVIDGKVDDDAWQSAELIEAFVDLAGRVDHPPRLQTRCRMMWDDRYFYVAAELSDPDVWGTLTTHDDALFREDAYELFLDPDDDGKNYAELQINPLGTTWDLKMTRPYREKGKADSAWEIAGLKSKVHVDGSLNDPSDTDQGWSVELAIPWRALDGLTNGNARTRGDLFRLNLVRVDWPDGAPGGVSKDSKQKPDYWAWSSAGETNTHVPRTWGRVVFITPTTGKGAP